MKLLASIFLLVAACTPGAASDLSKNHDLGPFSLTLPSSLRQIKTQGADSYVGSFEGPGLRVEFDYGWYSDPLRPDGQTGFVRTERQIGGRRAVIASWKRVSSLPYVAAIHFPAIIPNGSKLTIYLFSEQPLPMSEQIFSSVKFRPEEPAPAAPSHGQPPAKRVDFILSDEEGWCFSLFPDGRVVAQYGSSAGDDATLPAGSIDFESVVQRARGLLLQEKGRTDAQLVIIEDDAPGHSSQYLAEDDFLREVLFRNWGKWTFGFGGEARLRPLLEKIKKPKQPLPPTPKSVTVPAAPKTREPWAWLI